MTQHVLFIVSNAAVIGPHNRKTGFFFAEVVHSFDCVAGQSLQVVGERSMATIAHDPED
jgi:hypothetical protein